jgi:hypothetical protein
MAEETVELITSKYAMSDGSGTWPNTIPCCKLPELAGTASVLQVVQDNAGSTCCYAFTPGRVDSRFIDAEIPTHEETTAVGGSTGGSHVFVGASDPKDSWGFLVRHVTARLLADGKHCIRQSLNAEDHLDHGSSMQSNLQGFLVHRPAYSNMNSSQLLAAVNARIASHLRASNIWREVHSMVEKELS